MPLLSGTIILAINNHSKTVADPICCTEHIQLTLFNPYLSLVNEVLRKAIDGMEDTEDESNKQIQK